MTSLFKSYIVMQLAKDLHLCEDITGKHTFYAIQLETDPEPTFFLSNI